MQRKTKVLFLRNEIERICDDFLLNPANKISHIMTSPLKKKLTSLFLEVEKQLNTDFNFCIAVRLEVIREGHPNATKDKDKREEYYFIALYDFLTLHLSGATSVSKIDIQRLGSYSYGKDYREEFENISNEDTN